MIEFKNITKVYQFGSNSYKALKGVSFLIEKGELVGIIGASGSGKTTTMNILGLLDHPTSGEYLLRNKNVAYLSPNQRADLRNRHIGFIFQLFFLLPRLNALQNVGLPLTYRNLSGKRINKRALTMLERVGMAKFHHHKPSELSGGQQQRVAIARALVGKPDIILADEPTGALDSKTSQEVLDLLIQLNREEGCTVVLITHDEQIAAQCPRVIKMHDGLIVP
ncbi:ABC transporter ATP-binding protein [Coxiella burnetii]|uniref:ABC transporter ATP-binding protein n=1 Tax=Coxiella burnetii (strain RSA 493 / Nine Mile phase I) TaxID=227377 RepID=Q83AS1_COXBU|nr:ABC transporter ATP-binding protein [Coxiella burnetii]NP_820788.1 ABC transporter ATP-binding protein [Coxiella burnetii RSA 493]AAO91302.1 ABC transporter ATP-binding protein [Coxiella burnetii RSA 493]ACJ17630.1 ABC transporter ATP-binding protein [Coxiella burnetii CbuG_Q212]AML48295.1 macrolide ABC transporter ATP-binding protein [Coxiella burnetii]AML54309.1 macrolide ABC transporter ATP-binding protein [Coxiella burnetii]ARI66561.1 ABC transporter ATP-binding protein [Coxiella burne